MANNNAVCSRVLQGVFLVVLLAVFGLAACGSGGESVDNGSVAPDTNTCSTVTYNAPSGTANNIVYTFDKPYSCGQFANGDWWVSPDSAGGTVTISSISPAQTTRSSSGHVMNGAMVNPSSATQQGFDGDIPGGGYVSGLTATVPITINTTTTPISSVVKAASTAVATSGNNPQFQFVAVLTVINTAADMSGQFRPSYFGTSGKFQLAVSSINTSSLGQYNLSAVSAVAAYTFTQLATDTSGLQLDHFNKYINQYLHAYDNSYLNTGYGSEASIFYSRPLVKFASNDFKYSISAHKQALINYLQICIDLAGDVQGGTSFDGSGGGYGFGRKLPLLFAGQVLQNSTITGLASSGTFAEDLSFYQSTSTGRVLHGEYYSYGGLYSMWPNIFFQDEVTGSGSKTVKDPMGWTDSGSGASAGAYLACCVAAPTRYEAMAASMLGFGAAHPFDWLLLISNRIQNHGLQFLPDPFAKYDGVPGNLGITWGLNTATGYFFTGSGRTPSADGKTIAISHTDPMGEAMWTYWIANHDIAPPSDISTLAATQPAAHENVLNWSVSTGADHYNIYRATDSALSGSSYLGTTTSTTYTDSGLTTGNTYAYWVVAVDAAGNVSNMSNKVSGTSL